jgi:alpha-ribazole phosphatase
MKLWLIRHPQPVVAQGICYGASDVAAQPEALEQQAAQLAASLPQGLRVWTSPLQRCSALCEALQQLRPDLHISPDPRLQEMNFGAWEGRAWRDIPRTEFDAWMADFGNYAVGGAESVNQFVHRVACALGDLQRGLDQGSITMPSGAWVCHAGVIRAVEVLNQGHCSLHDAKQWPLAAPECGHSVQVDLTAYFSKHNT